MNKKLISIVTPCYNEEDNILNHFARVKMAIAPFVYKYEFEHIYTDNCSQDKTFEILQKLGSQHANVRAIRFSRNIGANRSIFMGLQNSKGDAIILIQADLQDPPELIPEFIKIWEGGHDVAYGKITQRSEAYWLQNARKLYYRLIARFSDVPIPTDAGEFRLTSRRALDALMQFDEDDLYIRGAMALVGYSQVPVPYIRAPRSAGESSTNFFGLIGYGINGLLSTTTVPLRLVSIMGFIISAIGFLLVLIFILAKILAPDVSPKGFTMLGVLITFFAGVQILAVGILGEYIRKIHAQSLKRPRGFIKDRVNLNE